MFQRIIPVVALCVVGVGCAHKPLAGGDLDRVSQPAFISRIEEGAGPRAQVFRRDGSYAPRLKKLDAREADRRLSVKLARGMSRFELADRLRATTFAQLPKDSPWSSTVDPTRVAQVLQSFLVDEVPANAPDYALIGELGADAIVEFVIEEYGMRSKGGKAGAYLVGYGRMFRLDGGELWRRKFRVDTLDAGMDGLDPFEVAKSPELWRQTMQSMLDGVAQQFAKDLAPPDRGGSPSSLPQKFEREEEVPVADEEDPI